ncbi:MAG: cytochrome c biogenesis CcdA family protein [Tomitella sp.]|nr:cytochrome c biogenesis CcdA family protein [Tomitella sp.]
MSSEVGLLGALLGGVLLLLSPCSALLLPSFFAYAFDGVGKLAARSALFYLGLATIMVPLGAGVGAFSSLVTRYRGTATLIGGIVLIVFGAVIILGKGFSFGPAQRASASIKISGNVSVYLLGTVYALAGFCAGPLIGAVLSLALIGSNPLYGGVIGAVFALGMTLPMFLLALLWDRFDLGNRKWLRGRGLKIGPLHTHTTSLVSGILFIAIGALFLATDGTANLGGIVGVETDQKLQEAVSGFAGAVSNTLVVFVVVVVIALALAARILWRRRGGRASSDVDGPETTIAGGASARDDDGGSSPAVRTGGTVDTDDETKRPR